MKNTYIFDLDGTLWNTEKSYYYAFQELLKHFPVLENKTNPEVIKTFKGMTMDKMMELLMPDLDKELQKEYILKCLEYSCYYLKNIQENDQSLIETIKLLANDNDLYIVSNCPFVYVDIFMEKTNLKNYFKDVIALGGFSLNTNDKANNIKLMIKKHNLINPYFIGDNYYDFQAAKVAKIKFIHLSSDDNNIPYDLQIYSLNELIDLDQTILNKEIEKRILSLADEYQEFSYYDAKVIYIKNLSQKEYQHLFGFLHLSKVKEYNTIIFKQMKDYLVTKNVSKLVGPINYNTWFDYRLPIDNFDTHFIPDIKGSSEDLDTLKTLGYEYLYTYASTLATKNKSLAYLASKAKLGSDYQIEMKQGKEVFNYAKEIFEISSKCFKNAYLYSDISFEECNDIYMTWLKKLPFPIDLMLIYYHNQIIAFGLCYPDTINKMYVCKTAAILKEHQNSNVVLSLANYVYIMADKHQMDKILFHYQNEQKNTLSSFWRNHVILKKRYALFVKSIGDQNE